MQLKWSHFNIFLTSVNCSFHVEWNALLNFPIKILKSGLNHFSKKTFEENICLIIAL